MRSARSPSGRRACSTISRGWGSRQEFVDYEKQPRTAGASGWTLSRKIRLVIDSVTAFSNAPLRWCAHLGAAMLAVALVLTVIGIRLLPELGGLLLVMALLFGLSGVQMLALAIVGEHVWSALAEARRRSSSSKPPRRTTCWR